MWSFSIRPSAISIGANTDVKSNSMMKKPFRAVQLKLRNFFIGEALRGKRLPVLVFVSLIVFAISVHNGGSTLPSFTIVAALTKLRVVTYTFHSAPAQLLKNLILITAMPSGKSHAGPTIT